MAKDGRKKSGGAKKYGRNAAKCKRYRDENRREKNKARRKAKRERNIRKEAV